ncbi:MAG: hypothetical protein JRH20_12110, partial [Deltaproteobacteria bacterium]|nr:hypothetical protein [Deltaproteobacteria bacterium]
MLSACSAPSSAPDALGGDSPSDDAIGESIQAQRIEVRPDGLYRGGKRFIALIAAGLPANIDEQAALAVGFDALLGPTQGAPFAMPILGEGAALADAVEPTLG